MPSQPSIIDILPSELFTVIVRWTDPLSGRNLRACNRLLKQIITTKDLVWAEGTWRLYHRDFTNCWRWAARNNHLDIIKPLFPTANPRDKKQLLHISAQYGHTDLLRFALDAEGRSAATGSILATAAGCGRVVTTEFLIERGADVCYGNQKALLLAASANHLEVVKLLLKFGATVAGSKALENTATQGHHDVLMTFLKAQTYTQPEANRALQNAVKKNHHTLVKELLKAGALIDALSMWAIPISGGYRKTVTALLEGGVDVHVGEDGPLALGVAGADLPMAQSLIEGGADVHSRDGNTFLESCKRRSLEMVRLLAKHGGKTLIDVNNGQALQEAAMTGRADVMRVLLESGADTCVLGDSALQYASASGFVDVVKLLVERGADVHLDRDEALFKAIKAGHAGVVEVLLDAGANVEARGDSLVMYEEAVARRDFAVAKALEVARWKSVCKLGKEDCMLAQLASLSLDDL
ncbi:hypothetical protein HDV00_002104 [Rhizophlyctis rosea]|nr:hypothetical protein HDV00_002104 [Rhizophlyctis rosea]